jgi:hypothetical protein
MYDAHVRAFSIYVSLVMVYMMLLTITEDTYVLKALTCASYITEKPGPKQIETNATGCITVNSSLA